MTETIKRFEGTVRELRELLKDIHTASPFTLAQTYCAHEDCSDMACNDCGADFS